MDCYKNIRS